jgi:hypothetical protein
MSSDKKEKSRPLLVTCPHCGRQVTTEAVVSKGFMFGRSRAKGGPYYRFKCIFCHKGYDCFFEKEIFTRKPVARKALIVRLLSWLGAFFFPQLRKEGGLQARPGTPSEDVRREAGRDSGEGPPKKKETLPLVFRVHPELLPCFRVLGLKHDAPPRLIRKRYKDLVKNLHPDKTTHLPKKERAEATKKLVEINGAYGTIKEYFM